jgi:hypothetical protein
MDGQHMMDWWILDMRNTTEFTIERMNLPDETNTLTELNHFGASQKEDFRDSMESRKPTFITI